MNRLVFELRFSYKVETSRFVAFANAKENIHEVEANDSLRGEKKHGPVILLLVLWYQILVIDELALAQPGSRQTVFEKPLGQHPEIKNKKQHSCDSLQSTTVVPVEIPRNLYPGTATGV
eukprot:1741627-Rhodomonas_salina.1